MIGKEALTSGSSGSESITTNKRERIDLGHGGPGANQTFDLGTNRVAAVETSRDIKEAGGPGTVLATSQEEVTEVNKTVSEVSDKLRNAASTDGPESLNENAVAAAGAGSPGPRDGPLAALFGFLQSLIQTIFGGF